MARVIVGLLFATVAVYPGTKRPHGVWSTLQHQRRMRIASGEATRRDIVGGYVVLAFRAAAVVVGVLYALNLT